MAFLCVSSDQEFGPEESWGKTGGRRVGYLSAKVRIRTKILESSDSSSDNGCWLKQLNHVEVGMRGENLFNELTQKIKALGTAVASLNTVKRKGKANADLMDLEEDDEMDE
ncbi:hypothetical protein C8R47DRAFT_1084923 [Mycena vitilis]|nr:hypothetical protein C8R47DRAFT_1084923 [Mycena vitilis]